MFDGGEEHIVAGDIAALTSQLFHSDIRSNCIYEVQTNIGPTEFMERLWMAKTGKKNAIFTIPVLNKNDPKSIREIQLRAVGVELHSGVPPSPKWIRNLWPIVAFDGSGFTIWNGSEWKKFKWDANNTPDGIRQPADGSPKPSS